MEDETINPWKTLTTKCLYENPWLSIREDSVIRPDGKPGIYGVVHLKGKCLGVLAVDDDEAIYLVGQYRYTLNRYSWEIPEGGSHEGEHLLDAAKRELAEETGITANQWEQLGTSHLSNSISDEHATWYLATGLHLGEANPEGTEQISVKRVPWISALNMIETGEITDSVSIMAIQGYALRRLREAKPLDADNSTSTPK